MKTIILTLLTACSILSVNTITHAQTTVTPSRSSLEKSCIVRSAIINSIATKRDQGISKEDLINQVVTSKSDLTEQQTKWILFAITKLYSDEGKQYKAGDIAWAVLVQCISALDTDIEI